MLPELSDKTNALVVSYLGIRRAIGISGLMLPIVLGPIGWLVFGIDIQDNMSAYYHTQLRDVFVGTMCAIGVFLFCYRGYDPVENWTANLGCISALTVALFPLDANRDLLDQRSIVGLVHTIGGGVFFLTLALYSLFHFPSTKDTSEEPAPHEPERKLIYRTSGVIILLSMIAMGSYLFLLSDRWQQWLDAYNFLFWMEWIAVWSFAAAWLTKGRTIIAEIAVDLLAIPNRLISKHS